MKQLITAKLSPNKMITSNGYLICNNAVLARTGKQEYLKSEIYPDSDEDEIIAIDRKPEQVFSEATITSFENVPLTCEHPYENVTPENYKEYSVGYVRDVHKGKYNGKDVLVGTLVVTDPQCIQDIQNGYRTELSCGYDCDITEGDDPQQINIRGNHVALCEQGRAGIAKIIDSNTDLSNCYSVRYKLSDSNETIAKFASLKGAMQMKRKVQDENSDVDYVEILDKDNNLVTKYISDSVMFNDVDLAVGSTYIDDNNNEWQITKIEGTKYVFRVNQTEDNKLDKQIFERMLGNELKPAQTLKDSFEEQKEYTYKELAQLEKDIYDYLGKHDIYPEDGTVSNSRVMSKNFFDITLIIDGDWKHDHLYCEDLIEKWIEDKGFELVGTEEETLEEDGTDSYKAEHIWHVGKDKEFAQSMKKMMASDSKTDHNKGFSKRFYTKLEKQLEKNLDNLDEFEIVLDSDDEEDYISQKNNVKRELRRQIKEYKNK